MMVRIRKFPRARILALVVGATALGSFAFASPAMAVVSPPPGFPLAGQSCAANATAASGSQVASGSGKISGRGATLPLYAVTQYIFDYSRDVCGPVAADTTANTYTPPAGFGEPTGDPTGPSNPVDGSQGASPLPTYNQDQMLAYNYPAAQDHSGTGSGQGRNAISGRTDAFSGSDIPYTLADFNKIDGAPGAECSSGLLTNCPPSGWVSPFQATGASTDPAGKMMSFPIVGGAIAIAVNLPVACQNGTPTAPTGFKFSTADLAALFSGNLQDWGGIDPTNDPNLTDACLPGGVPLVPTRVVRKDNSGTTQNFFNYLAAADPSTSLCGAGSVVQGANTLPLGTFGDMQSEITTSAAYPSPFTSENNVWPSGAGSGGRSNCNTLATGTGSGTPSLLHALVGVIGGVGYGDVSDVVHDPGDAGTLVIPTVEASDGVTYDAPTKTDGSANCSYSGATLPGTTADNFMGVNGEWALDAQTNPALFGNHTNVAFAAQGSLYPICALTWEFSWKGEDGNASIGVDGNQALLASPATLNVAAPAASTTTADIPVGTASPATISVTATSVALYTGQKVTVGGQALTLTANAAAGATSLTGNFAANPTTADIPSGATVTLPGFIDPANGAITSLPLPAAGLSAALFAGQVVTVSAVPPGGTGPSNTQNWTLSANAAKGATSLSVVSQTPAFVMPNGSAVATTTLNVLSAPTAPTPSQGTYTVTAGGALQSGQYSGSSASPASSTTTADIPVGTTSPATISVTATSAPLFTGQAVLVAGQKFTLTANAAAGATSLTGRFPVSPTTTDIPSGSSVTLPAALTGLQFVTGSISGSTGTVALPSGTGGPEPELNANQRRTLYSYMSYVLSDAAQGTAGGAGYAQLPEAWIGQLRSAFQTDY